MIYGLLDPHTNELRYIGRTRRNLTQRLLGHARSALTEPHARAKWFLGLVSEDPPRLPIIFEIEQTDGVQADLVAEKFWIGYYRYIGAALLNAANGDPGFVTPSRASAATRAHWSAIRKGRPLSEYHKQRIREGKKAKARTEKERAHWAQAGRMGPRARWGKEAA